jgi:hypothetical protein
MRCGKFSWDFKKIIFRAVLWGWSHIFAFFKCSVTCVWSVITNNRLKPLLQSFLITINYSAITNLHTSQITRTCSILALVLRCTPITLILVLPQLTSDLQLDYLYSLEADHRKYIRCPAMDICYPDRKRRFLYFYIYSALHSNGS